MIPIFHDDVGFLRYTGRVIAFAFAVALTAGIGWFGWQQVVGEPVVENKTSSSVNPFSRPVPFLSRKSSIPPHRSTPIEDVRSYDPLGDDNDDGQPDGVDGRSAGAGCSRRRWDNRMVDTQVQNSHRRGQGGVGLIVDLGSPKQLSTIDLDFVGFGTDVDIRVADQILDDPDLWTDFASVNDAGPEITLRSPRSVTGQYVLICSTISGDP